MNDDPRIDPADLRSVKFPGSFRRYDARAVDDFLETVAQRVEATNALVDDLWRRLDEVDGGDARPRPASSAVTVLASPAAEPEPASNLFAPEPEPDAAAVTPPPVEVPDLGTLSDDELFRLVGEETANVLSTARHAAEDIRSKAEESAARLIREATAKAKQLTDDANAEVEALTAEARTARDDAVAAAEAESERLTTAAEAEATRLREEAEVAAAEAERRAAEIRDQAEVEAAQTLADARDQGRSMVAEAKQVRARVLTDLQRRRDHGREQIERLAAGRNRLLDAYAEVRANVDDITARLDAAMTEAADVGTDPELDDQISAAVAEAAESEGDILRDGPLSSPEATGEVVADTADASEPEPAVVEPDADQRDHDESSVTDDGSEAAAEGVEETEPGGVEDEVASETDETATGDVEDDAEPAPDAGEAADADSADGGEEGAGVDELFARIRAERAESVARAQEILGGDDTAEPVEAADGDDASGDDADEEGAVDGADEIPAEMLATGPLHDHRTETIDKLERSLSRALKRRLADEQNQVLDELRRTEATEIDALLAPADEHVAGYAKSATRALQAAADAGAAGTEGEAGEVDVADLSAQLGRTIVEPFRRRIERTIADVDGDADALDERLRALYREWKVEHIGPAATDALHAAFAVGQVASAGDDGRFRWLLEPGTRACPDCHDNALAGTVAGGEEFPTGVAHPPAHPGCRCLLSVS